MRLEITIPDQLYTQAQSAAAAHGLTVDRFMADVLEVHLRDEVQDPDAVNLTDEQISKVRAGQQDVKAGRVHTPAQVRKHFQAKHDAWPASQS